MSLTKSALRKTFLKKRNLFADQNRSLLDDSFYSVYSKTVFNIITSRKALSTAIKGGSLNIGGYFPIKSEVNCLSVMQGLKSLERNLSFSLPIVPSNEEKVLKFKQYQSTSDLVVGKYNISVPHEDAPYAEPSVLLVPLLCFDKNCYRLGYGKGYYDCTIDALKAKNKNMITIGLAFDIQENDYVVREKHDVQLDYILTETRLLPPKRFMFTFLNNFSLPTSWEKKYSFFSKQGTV